MPFGPLTWGIYLLWNPNSFSMNKCRSNQNGASRTKALIRWCIFGLGLLMIACELPKIEGGEKIRVSLVHSSPPDPCDSNCTIQFWSNCSVVPDSVKWEFGDGNFSNFPNPSYTYALPGIYTVRLTCFKDRVRADTLAQIILHKKDDVYVAGNERNSLGKWVAKYWKNGEPYALSDGVNNAYAKAIFVVKDTVYVAGYETNSAGNWVAKYWGNGKSFELTDGTNHAYAYDIFVAGKDVIVTGYEQNSAQVNVALYWENGIPTYLSDGTQNARAFSAKVFQEDVYVAGDEYVDFSTLPTFWKNGLPGRLSTVNGSAYARSIFVTEDKIVVAGHEGSNGKYWINGNGAEIEFGMKHTELYASFCFDDEVFVAGYYRSGARDVAMYWTDRQFFPLTDGTENAKAQDIYVTNHGVHVVGVEDGKAKYWFNGSPQILTLTATPSSAESIFVVNH